MADNFCNRVRACVGVGVVLKDDVCLSTALYRRARETQHAYTVEKASLHHCHDPTVSLQLAHYPNQNGRDLV